MTAGSSVSCYLSLDTSMRFPTLQAWLDWQESLHPNAIDLGLERPGKVLQRLAIGKPANTVITVSGTNGKGSSVAMLESILLAAGYRVGCYTSPHLLRYNERIRINGEAVDDLSLCEAFERIDQARGETSLTYFEFGTLAAFECFSQAELDVAVLEVGLGGRLDAVNLIGADVALVTAIDVDHAAWLGNDREAIGYEKAGIFRAAHPAVCSDPHPPASLIRRAGELGVALSLFQRDFQYQHEADCWSWQGESIRTALPLPALRGEFQLQNAAGVLKVLELVSEQLPVSSQHLRQGLLAVNLPGRFQVLPGEVPLIVDVAHNPQSASALATNLRQMPVSGNTFAVVAMLADKDLDGVVREVASVIDRWYVAGLDVYRGSDAEMLAKAVADNTAVAPQVFASLQAALQQAEQEAEAGDRIVIFGSFYTVAEVLARHV